LGRTAILCRIAERTDCLDKFKHRARPAMSQDQRQRFWPLTFHMIEMNVVVIDAGYELRIAIQVCLRLLPVELRGPVVSKRPHVFPIRPVSPILRIEPIRQSRALHSRDNAVDDSLRNVDFERPDRVSLLRQVEAERSGQQSQGIPTSHRPSLARAAWSD